MIFNIPEIKNSKQFKTFEKSKRKSKYYSNMFKYRKFKNQTKIGDGSSV